MKIHTKLNDDLLMGGTWVDYNLQTTIPGCFSIGESNFSDHGANRLELQL
jgi:succinate dehydrogenase/fumarate reductase flavoprotein subunit